MADIGAVVSGSRDLVDDVYRVTREAARDARLLQKFGAPAASKADEQAAILKDITTPRDVRTGAPVGGKRGEVEVRPEDLEQARAEAEANRQAKLQRSIEQERQPEPTNAADYLAQGAPGFDQLLRLIDLPANEARRRLAKAVGAKVGFEVSSDQLVQALDDLAQERSGKSIATDPSQRVLLDVVAAIATDPLNVLPGIGLPTSAYKAAAKGALKAGKQAAEFVLPKKAPLEWRTDLPGTTDVFPGRLPGWHVGNVQQVPIGKLKVEEAEHAQAIEPKVVQKKIDQLAKDPAKVAPIVAEREPSGELRVVDGRHRIEGAKELGLRSVPVRVVMSPEVKAMVDAQVEEAAAESTRLLYENGGSTWNMIKGNMAGSDAYAVAIMPEFNAQIPGHASQQDIKDFISTVSEQLDLNDDALTIGTWFNKDKNRTELDVSVLVPDRQQAIKLATALNQQAIMHLGTFEEVRIGGSGSGFIKPYSIEERLAMVKLAQRPIAPAHVPSVNEQAVRAARQTQEVDRLHTISAEANGHGHPFEGGGQALDVQVGEEALAQSTLTPEHTAIAAQYDAAPLYDPEAAPYWDELIYDTEGKYDDLQRTIKFIPVDEENPYKSAQEMFSDIEQGVMKISTRNNEHPLWSPEQNFKFRAVHDYFGHFVPRADFTMQGEEIAYQAHSKLVPTDAKKALDVEVRGQAAVAIAHGGEFAPQKVYIPGKEYPAPVEITPEVHGAAVIARGKGKTLADFRAELLPILGKQAPVDDAAWKKLYNSATKIYARKLKSAARTQMPSTQHLMKLIEEGAEVGYDWYHAVPRELQRVFGEDWRMVAKFIAATSPQTPVAENINRAIDMYTTWKTSPDVYQAFDGVFATHRNNLERAALGMDFGEKSWKVRSFYKNLVGDPDAVTADGWIAKIFFGKNAIQSEEQYRFLEAWISQEARRLGVAPRDLQAALWVGAKFEAGLEKGEIVEPVRDTIKRAAQEAIDGGRLTPPPDLDEAGRVRFGALWLLARATVGAGVGGTFGGSAEERLENALIGAGLGALASPALIRKLGEAAKTTMLRRTPLGAAGLTRQEAARSLSDIAQQYRNNVEAFKRGVRPHDLARREGAERIAAGWTDKEAILQLYPGATMNDAEIAAMVEVLSGEAEKLQYLARLALDSNDPKVMDEFLTQFATFAKLDPRAGGVLSEAGRSLSFLNDQTNEVLQYKNQFSNVLAKVRVGQNPRRIAEMIAALHTPDQMLTFTRLAVKPGVTDMLLEVWINGLLSGFKTTTTNLLSNTYTLASSVGERALARWVPGEGGVVPGEATALLSGYFHSFGDAMEVAWRSFKDDMPIFGQSKLETRQRAITSENIPLMGKWADVLGTIVRLPGRALMAEDEFFKAIAFRGELYAQAQREAYREAVSRGLKGRDFSKFVAREYQSILRDPSRQSAHMLDDAREFALYNTFTKELGEVGQHLQAIAAHPLGRLVMPFVRTPLNIVKYAGERTPLALLASSFWRDIEAGGVARDLAVAKLTMGGMVMGSFAMLASAGVVTGSGPSNPEVKALWRTTGRQPYSINITQLKRMAKEGAYSPPQDGDEWIAYSRTDPAGILIGLAADWSDVAGHLDEAEADEIAAMLAMSVAKNMTSKTYVKGVAETFHWFTDPEHASKNPFENLARSFVPAAVVQFEQVLDPTVRETRTLLDEIKARVPGWSSTLPPKRNFWGEAIELDGGFGPDLVSPLYRSGHIEDPVTDELVRLNVPLEPISDVVDGVQLSPEQFDRLQVLFGKGKFIGGKTLHKQLASLMDSALYQEASDDPDGLKVALIREQVRQYKLLAKQQLKQEDPALARAAGESVRERVQKLIPRAPDGVPSLE